jgi:MYXO-CTERM domain-containing protein
MIHERFRTRWAALAGAGLASLALLSSPPRAEACGGLFCNSNRAIAVNQAAEQIIFAKNADGSVTAVIQIMYEGEVNKFAWVLPVSGVPDVAVSSNQAFVMLKQATNPSYQLNYQSNCASTPPAAFGNTAGGAPIAPTAMAASDKSAVTVLASGAIGPYEYDVIMVDPMQSDRSKVAVDWLTAHSYDVGPMGADLLRPYLDNDQNLIAFKLTKGSTTGSIRPVMLNFGKGLPAIPIRPTAVAANDDMGVLVWVLSDSRAIPQNYKGLVLNDALIDWFNPNNNYNKVVSKAANEAMGQGFVTEFAGKTAMYKQATGNGLIFPMYQQQTWDQFMTVAHTDSMQMIRDATNNWGTWDGFDDALRLATTLPSTLAFSDFKACLACYLTSAGVSFDRAMFLTQLYEKVIKPMAATQALLDGTAYMTRLYTTMSADEMTLDPAFDFNKDLGDVSNIHTATIKTGCGNVGPWTMDLPPVGTVSGMTVGTWPIAIEAQPAALKILQMATAGDGKVVEDRTDMITKLLKTATSGGTGGSGGGTGGSKSASGTGGSSAGGGTGGSTGTTTTTGLAGAFGSTPPDATGEKPKATGGGCSVAGGDAAGAAQLLLAALGALGYRRRRKQS